MKKRFAMSVGVLSIGSLLSVGASAQAAVLTYDLRIAESGNSAGVTRTGAKSITVTAVGDVVAFEVYGLLDSATAAADGISSAGGSVRSAAGGLLGSLSTVAVQSTFNGIGNSSGTAQDLDADTDIDVGGTTTNSNPAYVKFVTGNGANPVAGSELLLGTLSFTVTSLDELGTSVNFVPSVLTTGTGTSRLYHQFTVDGTAYTNNGNSATGTGNNSVTAGTAVGISVVPEPASLAVLGLGGLTLLGRKRKA